MSKVAAVAILVGATAFGASIHALYRRVRYGRALRAVEGLRCFALRLRPGEEIKSSLLAAVKAKGLSAACVLTCVGSVRKATLRMANANKGDPAVAAAVAAADGRGGGGGGGGGENPPASNNEIVTRNERFEIVSLVGTFSPDGSCHVHASLADARGAVWGGHVVGDLEVFTTAEIVLGECAGLVFGRELDECTGYPELVVESRVAPDPLSALGSVIRGFTGYNAGSGGSSSSVKKRRKERAMTLG